MEQNNFAQILSEFPLVFYKQQFYLGWQDFVKVTGLPATNLHKIISVIDDKPILKIQNRVYYRVDFVMRYHNWMRTKSN